MASPVYGHFPRPVPEPGPEILLFGRFELHLESRELFREGASIKLQDQPARLLGLLASRPGQLVDREAIRHHLWGDAVNVDFDQGINFCVKQIRRALDDSASQPRFVETVPRRGYRFVAPVERRDLSREDPPREDPPREDPPREDPPREDLSHEDLSHEDLSRNALSRNALSRNALSREDPPREDPLVPARPTAPFRAARRWAPGFAVALLLGGIAFVITRTPADREAPPASRSVLRLEDLSEAARGAYLEGVFLLEKENAADLPKALAALERTVELEPDFALGHAWLAEAIVRGTEDLAQAQAAVRRALVLDPSSARAYFVQGRVSFYLAYEWEKTREALESALELDPSFAEAHHLYACYLSSQGRHSEALAAAERASRLDPGSLLLASDVGLFAYFARLYDRAISESRHVLALDRDYIWAHRWIIQAATASGRMTLALEQAVADFDSLERRSGQEIEDVVSLESYWGRQLAHIRRTGREDRAAPAHLAMLALGSGEREEALAYLSRVCERATGWKAPFLAVHPFFDPLRRDPRFQGVLECLDLAGVPSGVPESRGADRPAPEP